LEVLFDDDSSGSDDVPDGGGTEPLPNAASSGSQPEWQQHVADELTALHLALETRARALNEREAALAEREARVRRWETQLASDDGLLRASLEKESSRLLADAQVLLRPCLPPTLASPLPAPGQPCAAPARLDPVRAS
jgi:hypothetical protein